MGNRISWLGHSSIKISGSQVIYIDPWKIEAKEKADLILISHSHSDHFSPVDIQEIKQEKTVILGPADCTARLSGVVRELKAGDEVTVGGTTVRAIPAYNINKTFHPRESGGLGFLIGMDGELTYYGGDTDLIPEMDAIRADVVILPVGGTYTMTPDEAAEAVNRIQPKQAIPIHYGDIVGSIRDARRFAELCTVPVTILPVEID
jgi:L-ascorbate metabolism protein UlaG (beta-lactamase superfamily)